MRVRSAATVFTILAAPQLFVSAQHVSSGYLDIPSWDGIVNSTYGPSLVAAPTLDYVNDTAVTLVWTLNTSNAMSRIATTFTVEVAFDLHSEDFVICDRVDVIVPQLFSNNSFTASYTATNLLSKSNYRFRICPIFEHMQGHCSLPLSVTTLDISNNYWEPIISRRLSLAASGRGFTAPVLGRPHLDSGVEVYAKGLSEDPFRFADPVTAESPVLPSGRRGHSLSQIDQTVFMFGGRTNGYSCANVYKDILNLGNSESGRDVYPCVHFQSEVHELWSFDVNNYQWVFLNTSQWQSHQPAAREQHSAVVIDRNLYIFGGKSRIFEKDSGGQLVMTPHSDLVFGDLWRLDVERPQLFELNYSSVNPSPIPQNGRFFAVIDGKSDVSVSDISSSISPRHSLCVDKLVVKVTVHHPCIKQLKLSLFGPGPQTGSPNFFSPASDQEVLLIDRLTSNGTGCISGDHEFEFDDSSKRLPENCCPTSYSGVYRPQGPLSEYTGSTMATDWTLVLQDLVDDSVQGYLKSFSLVFTSSPCFKKFTWTNLTTTTTSRGERNVIPARSAARAVAYEQSMFIFGGRDRFDNPLSDLWRFDVAKMSWTKLTPIQFDSVLNPASSVGANYLLTTWGLVRIGGYYRQPKLPERYDNYDNSVSIQDPVTLRWTELRMLKRSPLGYDSTFGRSDSPSPRYLGAAVFISSHTLDWQSAYTDRALYDQLKPSQRTNFQGTLTDSILLFGGFDGSTGSVFDGSSGGYLSDSWMLRLANYSTAGSRFYQQDYVDKNCRWRKVSSALKNSGTGSCMSNKENASCEWRDLLMLAWCSANNQTIS